MKHSRLVADEDQTPLAKLLEWASQKQHLDNIFDEIFKSALCEDIAMNRIALTLLGALMTDKLVTNFNHLHQPNSLMLKFVFGVITSSMTIF